MKHRLLAISVVVLVSPAFTLDGDPRMHDPSTVVQLDGRFYRPVKDIMVTVADR
jgi:hypothetical protein